MSSLVVENWGLLVLGILLIVVGALVLIAWATRRASEAQHVSKEEVRRLERQNRTHLGGDRW